jgi:hypothetical protein
LHEIPLRGSLEENLSGFCLDSDSVIESAASTHRLGLAAPIAVLSNAIRSCRKIRNRYGGAKNGLPSRTGWKPGKVQQCQATGRRNLVIGVGLVLVFFSAPHLIDDFLCGIPEEFGLTNPQTQVLAGVFHVQLVAFFVLAGGSPLTKVQAILGHAHISSTAIYTQPSGEEKATSLQKASEEF